MSKALKIISSVIAAFILLVIVAVVILVNVIDPNDYKTRLHDYVKQETGRDLFIEGKVTWSFFPWLGFHIPYLKLGNPSNLSGPNLADIRSIDLKISTLGLLAGRIDLQELALNGAKINLITSRNQQTNWNQWAPVNSQPNATPSKKKPKNTYSSKKTDTLRIKTFKITHSQINVINHYTNTACSFTEVNLSISHFGSRQNFPLQLAFSVKQPKSKARLESKLTSTVNLDLDTNSINFTKLAINNELLRPGLPALPIKLHGKLSLNPQRQTLELSDSGLSIANLVINTNLKASQLFQTPSVTIHLESKNTQLGAFLANVYDKHFASGVATFSTDLNASGTDLKQIISSLGGKGKISVTEGAVEGIDIGRLLNQAVAYLKKQPQPPAANLGPHQTRFQSLSASYTIHQGQLYNPDFKMISGDFTTTGKGRIDLVNKQWANYQLSTRYKQKTDQHNFVLPIVISGPLDKPRIVPNFEAIAKRFITHRIEDYLKTNTDSLSKKIKGLFN